ncbi:hypothetical protein FQZ97_1145370 [compost metagenome]
MPLPLGFFSVSVGVSAASACGCARCSVTSGSVHCPNEARSMFPAAATCSIRAINFALVAKVLGPAGSSAMALCRASRDLVLIS